MDDVSHSVASITTLAQIEALSSPIRLRILRHASRPISVTDLADRLGAPVTRLYYHVNLLVEAEMLTPVGERRSGARTEKLYRRSAADFRLEPEFGDVIGDRRKAAEAAATVLFEPARAETEDFLERALDREKAPAQLGRTLVRLTPAAAEQVAARMDQLFSDVRDLDQDDEAGTRTYSMTAAFLPVDDLE